MFCFKVNPPFLDRNQRKEAENLRGLVIPHIKCYYNLQLGQNLTEIKTSLYPADIPYMFKLYNLYTPYFTTHNRQPQFRTQQDQIVREKILNVETNCGSKERFYFDIMAMQNRVVNNNNLIIPHQPQIPLNNLPVPRYCIYNCETCRTACRFTIENLERMPKRAIEEELSQHNHRKSLIIDPRTKRQRNLNESRDELIAHYRKFHNF